MKSHVVRVGFPFSGCSCFFRDNKKPFVGHRTFQLQVQLRLRLRHLDIRLVDLHLVETEGILLDPLVPDCIEHKVLQAAEQIDCSIVVAFVHRLHMGVQPVDVLVGDSVQRQILLLILNLGVLGYVAQQTVVPAFGLDLAAGVDFGREAGGGDSCIDGALPFLEILAFLRKKTAEKVVRHMAAYFLRG